MGNCKEKQWCASESMKMLNISFSSSDPLCSWPPHFEMVRSNELHSSFAKNFQKWVSSSRKQWLVGFAVRVACNNRISKESNKDFQFHSMPPPNRFLRLGTDYEAKKSYDRILSKKRPSRNFLLQNRTKKPFAFFSIPRNWTKERLITIFFLWMLGGKSKVLNKILLNFYHIGGRKKIFAEFLPKLPRIWRKFLKLMETLMAAAVDMHFQLPL